MLLSAMESCCWLGVLASGATVAKLIRMRYKQKTMNILNWIFLAYHFLRIILMSIMTISFFNMGYKSFERDNVLETHQIDCKMYLISWTSFSILSVYLHLGMIFCRFIYTRYAHGFMKLGTGLFHKLVCIVTTTFCLQHVLFRVAEALLADDDFTLNMIQGQICNKRNITHFIHASGNTHNLV